MDLAELLERLGRITELTSEELAQLEADLNAAADSLLDDRSADALDQLETIADGLDAVRAEGTRRDEEAAANEQRAADLERRIRGEQSDDGEPVDESSDESENAEPEAVAAAAAPARTAARRPSARPAAPATAVDESPIESWGLVASASGQTVRAGQRITQAEQLADVFLRAWTDSRGYNGDQPTKVRLAITGGDPATVFPAERYLGRDPIANGRRIRAVTGPDALVAAGGICAPINVDYDQLTVGTAERPVRDEMMARFGADRGGVRTIPGPVIEDLDDAMGVWTNENDENPTDPTTKPCLTITCPTEVETLVEALTFCLQTGNFRARFFPEQIEAWVRLGNVARARQAENRLLAAIAAGSTLVNGAAVVGAAKDILTYVDLLVTGIRSRHRLGTTERVRVGMPFWVQTLIRTDLAREMPGTQDERFAVAEASMNAWFAARSVNVTWFLDGQVFAAQTAGAILGFPDADGVGAGTQVDVYAYPEGAWLFLDGGELDLGIVRDSTLNSTNDFRMFQETFEGAHFLGTESYRARLTLCATGAVTGTLATTACS